MVPSIFRAVFTQLFIFPVTAFEWQTIRKELAVENLKAVEKVLPLVWATSNSFLLINLINKKFFSQFDELLV